LRFAVNRIRSIATDETGSVSLWFILSTSMATLLILALVVDIGNVMLAKAKLQDAAFAAGIGGAREVDIVIREQRYPSVEENCAEARRRGIEEAQRYAQMNGVSGAEVEAVNFCSEGAYLRVTVERDVHLVFARLIGISSLPLRVSYVAYLTTH